jgi:hypothetical protein
MSAPTSRKASSRPLVVQLLYFVGGLLGLVVLALAGLRFYFEHNKARIVADLNQYITGHINGTVRIGNIDLRLLTGFPTLSLALTDIELKDLAGERPLLRAKEIDVGLNVMRLFHREIDLQSIVIDGATIDLFTDENGVTNSSIFKPAPPAAAPEPGRAAPAVRIGDVALRDVDFKSEDLHEKKLFHFVVASLHAAIHYEPDGPRTDLKLKALAKSMTFLAANGSFIEGQELAGVLKVAFSKSTGRLTVETPALAIGKDSFAIKGWFGIGSKPPLFELDIRTNILWHDASHLLSPNIQLILNHFDLPKPLEARCVIHGDLNDKGDPAIVVNAKIQDNEIRIAGRAITNVSFHAEYNNHSEKGKPNGDPNSVVTVSGFTGTYGSIPFQIPGATIANLLKPVASGTFKTEFGLAKLNELIDERLILFSDGQATVSLDFHVALDDLKLHQPRFQGAVGIRHADLLYRPKNLRLQTDIDLAFTDQALSIRNVKYVSGASTLVIDGEVDNFFSLYYDSPEKMVVALNARSPFLDAKTFLGTAIGKKETVPVKSGPTEAATRQLRTVIDKCQMVLNIQVDKAVYEHLEATNARAQIVLADDGLNVKNGNIETSGGKFAFDAHLEPRGDVDAFGAKVKITACDIPRFLKAFNNFGITSFTPGNITGDLSAEASLSGSITPGGDLVGGSLKGDLKYQILNGTLVDFEPLIKVGKKFFVKLLFGKRDFGHIAFGELAGNLRISGHKVDVDFFRVSSSVLNFDVMGIYSFKQGTNLGMTIPLRDPEDDAKIANKAERDKLRYKGIVLHLVAVDGKDGGVEVKTGKYKVKDETAQDDNASGRQKSKKSKKS